MNYYNEFDSKAAQWIRELIKEGVIPDGIVDERSITDVRADELTGFRQCHFFAGVAGWSFALRLAGLPDDFSCWTGSCPCQPFSNAGKRKGVKDERDLWPVFGKLIAECRPEYVFGEQVASAIKLGWIDRVHADLEREGYACGEIVLGAHSVGANHIRQRLYWGAARMADPGGYGFGRRNESSARTGELLSQRPGGDCYGLAQDSAGLGRGGRSNADPTGSDGQVQASGLVHNGGLALSESRRYGEREYRDKAGTESEVDSIRQEKRLRITNSSHASFNGRLSNPQHEQRQGSLSGRGIDSDAKGSRSPAESTGHCAIERLSDPNSQRCIGQSVPDERRPEMSEATGSGSSNLPPWSDFGLVLCRDTDKQGRHRVRRVPSESVLLGVADGLSGDLDGMRYQSICERPERAFPLCTKDAVPGRTMLLKGYGNAIVPELAAEFIKSFLTEVNR